MSISFPVRGAQASFFTTKNIVNSTKPVIKLIEDIYFYWGEYKIYFIKCVENIRIFTSASDVFNSRDEIYLGFTENK